eukprot:10761585-Karenia_brevis.AAC.1
MCVADIEGPVPRTVTLAEMIAPITTDVATDMGLPRHCARNVGTNVAKCLFRGFMHMGGGPLSEGNTILHAKISVPMS